MYKRLKPCIRAAALLLLTQACTNTPTITAQPGSVTDAYSTSGIVPAAPYTRTIFSSTNF